VLVTALSRREAEMAEITLSTLASPGQMDGFCEKLQQTGSAEIAHVGKQFTLAMSSGGWIITQGAHSDADIAAFHTEVVKFAEGNPNAHHKLSGAANQSTWNLDCFLGANYVDDLIEQVIRRRRVSRSPMSDRTGESPREFRRQFSLSRDHASFGPRQFCCHLTKATPCC
jgi:hypothetical protein